MSKFKKILLCTLAVVLTVAVSAGTAILVNRNDNLPASAEIKNGLSAYELAVQSGFNGTLSSSHLSFVPEKYASGKSPVKSRELRMVTMGHTFLL